MVGEVVVVGVVLVVAVVLVVVEVVLVVDVALVVGVAVVDVRSDGQSVFSEGILKKLTICRYHTYA